MANESYNAGIVTAYGAAVRGGYRGSYQQWCQDMAALGQNLEELRGMAAQVEQDTQAVAADKATVAQDKATVAADKTAAQTAAQSAEISQTNAAGAAIQAGESADAAEQSATAAASSAAEARRVEESIPESYEELSADVGELKSALNTSVSGTNDAISQGGVVFPSTWAFGTLDASGSIATQSVKRRCVTEKYMQLAEDNVIKVEAGYSVILCLYNTDLTLNRRTIYNGAVTVNVSAGTIFRVCILLSGTEVSINTPYDYIDKAYLILPYVNTLTNKISTVESATNQNTADIAFISQSVSSMFDNETVFVDVEDATHTEGGFIRTSGNLDPVSGYSYFTVPCQGMDIFDVTSFAGSAARLWLVKSASNTVIDYSSDSSAPSLKHETVTIPANGATLIVNTGNGSATIKKASVVRVIKDDLLPAQKNNRLYGKVYCAVGDSITYGEDMDADGITQTSTIEVHQWSGANSVWNEVTSNFRHSYAYQIAERNNMILWNGGVSGSTMQGIAERRGFSLANGRYTQLPDSIDYLTIFFGWNDTAYGTLGTITDTTNESYYGGYNVVLPYLINKYPYAKIALIVPFGTDEGHRNAIRQLGNKWGVAVWDNYQGGTPLYYGKEDSVGVESSIVTANRAKFQANGAHPNYKGHTQIADMIEEFLRGI